ncbi:MAG: hypothetical protein OEV16_03690 [Gammaproteobacteria bacterium]|jgi:hypothetical protein|nr:hypothetical protein [Gammaproteobacteria bacterium]
MRKYRISRPTQALVAANVTVALLVALQVLYPATASVEVDTPPESKAAVLPDFGDTNLNPPAMSHFVDMLDRPVFYIERRLPEPPAAQSAPPPSPLRLKLEGIAIAGGSRVAVLRNLNGNGLLQLAEGDTHDGWTLESVSSTAASFKRGEQVTELPLDPAAGGLRR